MANPLFLRPHTLALALLGAGLLTACGSGGGSDGGVVDPPPPVAPGITLAGVVAKGAALANVSVAVTCATGTGTATTGSSGSYSVTITGGALPCVLKATSSDGGTKLHSVAPASTSSSVTANVTPLTELVVAQLTGKDPATYVAAVVPSTLASTATASAVATAQTALASTLAAGGLNTSTAGDFISGTLVAANGSTTGNAYDQVLDALNAKLVAGGSTLAALTATIAANSPAAPPPPPTDTGVATLPADLLLKPKAANCASLASTRYQLIKLASSPTATVTAVDTVDFDAPTLTSRLPGTQTVVGTWTANGNCRYTSADGADIVVSPAGVVVARATIGLDDTSVAPAARGTKRMVVGLPVQTIAVADLAGNWNLLGWERPQNTSTTFDGTGVNATIASNGAITQARCGDITLPDASCTADTAGLPVFSANAAGGFNMTSTDPTDPYVDRAFAYRAGNGALMMAFIGAYGGDFFVGVKAQTLTLPAVGTVTANWNVDVRVTGLASDPLYYRTHTVASVNSTAGTLVRNTAADGSTVTAPQTLEYNKARDGYLHRVAATATASDGSLVNVREFWALPMRGFGLTGVYLPGTSGTGASSNAIFELSIAKQP
jgi:hypothetical protein